MTVSSYDKVFVQLDNKPVKKVKYLKHNKPKERSCGFSKNKCRKCGSHRAFVRRYALNYCRRCFRELAKTLGFKKFN